MKTSIVYMSSHGTTEKVAKLIQAEIKHQDTEVINLRTNKSPALDDSDQIIIGASIHAGRIPKRIRKLLNEKSDFFKSKKLGLFLCCMEEGKTAKEQFENAFPKDLRETAISAEILGGEFNFDRMNFIERAIVKKISGSAESVSKLKMDKIKQFSGLFN